jgi:hypothetical protein
MVDTNLPWVNGRHAMTVTCFVFRPKQGSPEPFKFVVLPRVGEEITLPGYNDDLIVESIEHTARKPNQDKSTVQMHLGVKPMKHRKIT